MDKEEEDAENSNRRDLDAQPQAGLPAVEKMLGEDQQHRHRSQEIQVGGNLAWQETPTHERNFASKTTKRNKALERSVDRRWQLSAEPSPL
jgi:hypothetical protein